MFQRSKPNRPTPADPLVDGRLFRAELGISEATFHRWRKAGRIPAPVALPGVPRWRRSTVEALKATGGAGQANVIPSFGTEPNLSQLARAAAALPEAAWAEIVAARIGL